MRHSPGSGRTFGKRRNALHRTWTCRMRRASSWSCSARSGCGKSTLLNAIAGLLRTSSGGPVGIGGARRHMGRAEGSRPCHGVPVLRALSDDGRVRESRFRAAVAGLKRRTRSRRGLRRAAEMLGLDPFLHRRPSAPLGRPAAAGRDRPGARREVDVFLFDEPLRTSTRSCAPSSASRSSSCMRGSATRPSTSPTIRSRR